MSHRKRSYQKIIRFDEEELLFLKKKMSLANTRNFEHYARQMLLGGLIIHKDFTAIRKLIIQMTRIGTNINQIAKKVNQTGQMNQEDLILLQRNFRHLSEEVNRYLLKNIYADR